MAEATPTAADLQVQPTTPIEAPENVAKSTRANPPPENFADAMRRLGGDKVFNGEDGPKAEGDAEAEPDEAEAKADDAKAEPEKPKAAKKEPEPATEESAQLEALAKKLGFVLENGRVTTVERAKFREERRSHSEALTKAEKEALAKIEEARKSFDTELGEARALKAARDSGDPNAFAKAIGFEDWNKLQEHYLSHQADPNYKRVLELEEWKRKTEEERQAAEAQRAQQEQEQRRVQAQNEYRAGLAAQMKASQDVLIAAMAEDPLFVNAIYNIQASHYDGQTTVTPEQAIKIISRGGSRSLQDEMKALYERLGKAFGGTSAPKPAEAAAPPAKKPKAPPAPPTPRPAKLQRHQSDRDFMSYAKSRMEEAQIEERRAEREGRRP